MTTLQLVSIGAAAWCATDLLIVWLLWRRETPTMRRERRLRELAPLSGRPTVAWRACQHHEVTYAAGHLTCLTCEAPLYEMTLASATPTHGLMEPRTKRPPNKVEIALQARKARTRRA